MNKHRVFQGGKEENSKIFHIFITGRRRCKVVPVLRRQHILEYLKRKDSINILDMAGEMGISQSTIRRDLKELEQQGEIEMFHGGGVRLKKESVELDLEQKMVLNREEKERIAEQELREFRFSKCFLGANGISVEFRISNHDPRERAIKRIAINNSVKTYFLIDSVKYGVSAMCKVADFDECTIITGKQIPQMDGWKNVIVA